MSIVNKVSTYLDQKNIHYQLVEHPLSHSSLSSAVKADIMPEQLVKGIMLEDHSGNALMAILPASHRISLTMLNDKLNRKFHLLKEADIYQLFNDCEHGAVPPVAQAYHIECVYDENLMQQADLYMEAGDHQNLIKLSNMEFTHLMQNARPLHFSHRVFH